MTERGLLLVGHGSREPEGNEQFLRVAERIQAALQPAGRSEAPGEGACGAAAGTWVVQPCFIELAVPEVPEGIDRLVARGCREVVAVPLTLFAAGHVKEDIPGYLAAAMARHPGVTFRYARPVGVEPAVIPVLRDTLAAARLVEAGAVEAGARDAGADSIPAGGAPAGAEEGPSALLLAGRGSSDPDANSDFFKLARLLWEHLRATGRPFPVDWVEECFIGITEPDLDAGLEHCVRAGARRVYVLPYFLFTGVLMQRIRRRVSEWAGSHPGVRFYLAGTRGIGEHPAVAEIFVQRAREAAAGPVFAPAV